MSQNEWKTTEIGAWQSWDMSHPFPAQVVTSFSAVACEYAYKATSLPLCRQNMVLYAYGSLLNLVTALAWRVLDGDTGRPWTDGFTAWTWAVVLTQASSGYAIGALLKYVDAVGQVFADVVATIVTACVSAVLFGLVANFEYGVSLWLCCASLLVYYSQNISDHLRSRREHRSAADRAAASVEARRKSDEQALGFWATRSPLVVSDPNPGASVELVNARKMAEAPPPPPPPGDAPPRRIAD